MTAIERKIYKALQDGCPCVEVAVLYVDAHAATYNVYSRIQWGLLDAEILRVLGKRALNQCRRAAVKTQ